MLWPTWAAAATIATCALIGVLREQPRELVGEEHQRPVVRKQADFGSFGATAAAHRVADWALASDAAGRPFVIVDKVAASIYVFGADGVLRGSAPVLLGAAIGDDTVPGIGERPIEQVLPDERTTPAGRFVGEPGRNARNEDVIWVDYDAAVSMHRVVTFNAVERRLERLSTPAVDDNRISYGCINIPADFYDAYVRPAYAERNAVVYVLPEVKSLDEVFAMGVSGGAGQLPNRPLQARFASLK
jgi:hypothetical protein